MNNDSTPTPHSTAQRISAMSNEVPPFVSFSVSPEYRDENGLLNPRDGEAPLEAAYQVNVFGSKEHYLKLAEFFRAFAELDTSSDGDFHEHYEDICSLNGKVRLNIILRKDDAGDATWR